jgi:hypothetical protein
VDEGDTNISGVDGRPAVSNGIAKARGFTQLLERVQKQMEDARAERP